ncbi:MAG: YceI family protein [Tepidiformaceae bacterium]
MAWQIDPNHANVGFTGKHMLVSKVKGKFQEYEADLDIDEANLANSTAVFRVNVASVESGFDQRDNHLRSVDFFDAEQYPHITFTTREIQSEGGDQYRFAGDLTIRDVTRPVVFEGEIAGPIQDPWGGTRISLSATTKVNRKDWGLDWNLPLGAGNLLVSDEITLEIDAELVKQAA